MIDELLAASFGAQFAKQGWSTQTRETFARVGTSRQPPSVDRNGCDILGHSMSLRRRFATGMLWAIIDSGGRDAISLLIFVLLARLLGPEAYGLVAMAMIVIGLGQLVIADGSANEALIQLKELEPLHVDTVFWTLFCVAGTLMLGVWMSARILAAVFEQPQVAELARLLSPILLLSALSAVPTALLRRELRFRSLALRSLVAVAVGGSVGIGMAWNGYGVWSLVGVLLAQKATEVAFVWAASGWRPGVRVSWRHFREVRRYGVSMIGMGLVGFIDQQVPRLLIGYFLGPVALGHFALSRRVFQFLMTLVGIPLNKVAMPIFARLQDDLERLRKVSFAATQLVSSIAFPSFIGLAVVAPELVPQLLGDQWEPAAPLLQMFCLMGIAYTSIYFANPLIRALGRPDWLLMMVLIGTTLNVIALLVASRFGLLAIAVVFLVRAYLVIPSYFWLVHRLVPLDLAELFRLYVPVLASSLVMAGAVTIWRALSGDMLAPELALVISILLGAAVYAGVMWFVACTVVREMAELLRLVVTSQKQDVAAEEEGPEWAMR